MTGGRPKALSLGLRINAPQAEMFLFKAFLQESITFSLFIFFFFLEFIAFHKFYTEIQWMTKKKKKKLFSR